MRQRKTILTLLMMMLICIASRSHAQEAKLDISHLEQLEAKASKVVTVDIPENLLRIAAKFLNEKDPDEARVKEIVSGLRGVYVRSFEFDSDNQFSEDDVKAISSQLISPRWQQLVDVRSKKEGQIIKVYTLLDSANKLQGIAVLATERRELTVVNIVGPVDLDKLAALSGNFSIPKLEIERVPARKKEN